MNRLEDSSRENGQDILDLMSNLLRRGDNSAAAQVASRRLLLHFGSAQGIANASLEEIRKAGKVTANQARSLFYAVKLGRRVCSAPFRAGERFSNSNDLFQRYRARFYSCSREHFYSIHLNSKNRLIREVLVSIGSLNTSVVHPREVFAPAVRDSAAALIFIHNHPSGDPSPSREDVDCTRRLVSAGRILGIRVLDHVVFGHDGYYSFSDAGRLNGT
ncbi:MAG: DNA repair protein RadC [Acidobacteria bacterium]|nr:DNA repair protein RadC [Acidobacteriota bacterium]